MASEVSIQIRINAAVEKLEQIARANGIQDEFPRNARGGEGMLRAVQLETVVAWIDSLIGSGAAPIEDQPQDSPVVVKASKKK